ncbi:HAD family phosphatase [Candidatus Woesearchaeota archaeon]|nr:HAD family phosphatase [Candidatus Woesearchaeota archaeon]
MIKTIIFDLGSVIVNVDKTGQFGKFAADSGKTIPYIKEYFGNCSSARSFGRGEISPKQFYCKVSDELGLKMSFDSFKNTWCDIFTLNRDVERIIKKLKANFRLVLLSNTDILHFGHIKNSYNVIDAFDEWVLSYEVGHMKPNPLIFLNALKKADALPFNCLYFDDIAEFVYVARLMGIRAFQYRNYEKLIHDLSNAKVL